MRQEIWKASQSLTYNQFKGTICILTDEKEALFVENISKLLYKKFKTYDSLCYKTWTLKLFLVAKLT